MRQRPNGGEQLAVGCDGPRRALFLALLAHAGFEALLQTLVTAGQRHPVWGSGSIGKMLIEHVHG
ncbi:hypothetical protein ACQKPB_21135, partial [Sphingomonas sp. NPDC085925]|uniref:hypothetical protein n=1 Tax=unclassified Sphingomonas TaxID=196159 RepID=UPI003CFCBECF